MSRDFWTCISKVIGESAQIALFDKLHGQLKAKSANRAILNKYKDMEVLQFVVLTIKMALFLKVQMSHNI